MKKDFELGLTFDDIAELAARTCGADICILSERSISSDAMQYLGKYGVIGNRPTQFNRLGLHPDRNNLLVFMDVQTNPLFDGHAVRNIYPVVHTLVLATLVKLDDDKFIAIGIPNVSREFLQSASNFARFISFLNCIRRLFEKNYVGSATATAGQNQLDEAQPEKLYSAQSDVTLKFLLETLSKRQALHDARDSSYFSVRTWRSSVKQHQVEALKAMQLAGDVAAAEVIGSEIAELAIRNHGHDTISCVVPVPHWIDGKPGKLVDLVGEAVARKLKCPCNCAFQYIGGGVAKSGKQRSGSLKLVKPIQGSVLLVTERAESGQKIDAAQKAVRKLGVPSFAISWIGP